MTRLPVIDSDRTEFGFRRGESCSCEACTEPCEHVPGFLVPADLVRLTEGMSDDDAIVWASVNLRASPGAVVAKTGSPPFRVPSLVPATQPSGACVFLTADRRCGIHDRAPYGCAFFDQHMAQAEGDLRSATGIRNVIAATREAVELIRRVGYDPSDPAAKRPASEAVRYVATWAVLAGKGLVAESPEVRRARMATARGRR